MEARIRQARHINNLDVREKDRCEGVVWLVGLACCLGHDVCVSTVGVCLCAAVLALQLLCAAEIARTFRFAWFFVAARELSRPDNGMLQRAGVVLREMLLISYFPLLDCFTPCKGRDGFWFVPVSVTFVERFCRVNLS